jgi:acyl-CoA synthetase (AMP-forming)/AMP-acid ligase II
MTEAAGGGTTVGEPDTADLADQLRAVMAIDPSAPFLQFEGRWSTWGDLAASVDSVDALLSGAGLGAAAPIGIVLRNRPETLAALIAVLATRRAVVTLNPAQPDNVLAADIERQRLPAVIACGSDWAREPLVDAARASGAMAIQMAAPPADPATTLAGLDRRRAPRAAPGCRHRDVDERHHRAGQAGPSPLPPHRGRHRRDGPLPAERRRAHIEARGGNPLEPAGAHQWSMGRHHLGR